MQKFATIELPAENANAFEVLAICRNAAERANVEKSKIDDFLKKAISGDFEHLLRSVKAYFHIAHTVE